MGMFVETTENTEISAAASLLKVLNGLSLYCRCDPIRATENVTSTWTRNCWNWKNWNLGLWGNGHFHLKELEVVITKPLQSSKRGQWCSYTAQCTFGYWMKQEGLSGQHRPPPGLYLLQASQSPWRPLAEHWQCWHPWWMT